MGDTWYKLIPEKTKRIITIDYGEYKQKKEQYENCFICCKTNCTLVGCYGTYNEFGSFKGVCLECLSKLNKLKKEIR